MDEASRKVLGDIVRVYRSAKELQLLGQEVGHVYGFDDYLQPDMECRRAFDHMTRALAVEVGEKESDDEDYIEGNLSKALGHVYRAFFDAADWCAINFREHILHTIEGFSFECINAAIPDYYGHIRARIEEIGTQIAELRDGKDVVNTEMPGVQQYVELVKELHGYARAIAAATVALNDCKTRRRRAASRTRAWQYGMLLAAGVVGAIVGYIWQAYVAQ